MYLQSHVWLCQRQLAGHICSCSRNVVMQQVAQSLSSATVGAEKGQGLKAKGIFV